MSSLIPVRHKRCIPRVGPCCLLTCEEWCAVLLLSPPVEALLDHMDEPGKLDPDTVTEK